ncbi:MAG: putative sulfate exporter family transporter [Stygiobacter sp.]
MEENLTINPTVQKIKNILSANITVRELIFIIALIFCLTPYATPPIALAIGILLAFSIGHPYLHLNHNATKILLQISVVGLGFGMNLGEIISVGMDGIYFSIASISGTAICGGSAIAAIAPVVNADANQMSVSLGTVFILNSVALFLFPSIGHLLHLTQTQFGFWAGIAIHDTSSVVGAAAKYGDAALKIATTVKLARALWIVPIVLITSFIFKNKSSKVSVPYFIFLFVAASVARTYLPIVNYISDPIVHIAKIGLTLTLFLIGAGLSKKVLKNVGFKPLFQGVILWIIISVVSLAVIINVIS